MHRFRRLGVSGRVQAVFALGGLLVSVFLAAVSWSLTTTYLQDQREITATRNTLVSADLLERRLADGRRITPKALQQSAALSSDAFYVAPGPAGSVSSTPRLGLDEVPQALAALAADGTPAQQRIVVDGRPVLAVAVPLADARGVYVELFPLVVLDRTLRGLSVVLTGTAALATLLAAVLGRWAARRTLQPLHALVSAANEVAHGSLDTHVEADGDPDLLPLAEAFNTTTRSLRARVARDARFASDVSHELRSPVTTMINAAELLENRRHELSSPGQEALDLLRGEVRHFRQLVEDLLEVSRDDQQLDLQCEPLRLAHVVRRVADSRAGGPVTRTSPEVEDLVVTADPRRLERIVGNLVDNAFLHGQGVREVVVERAGCHVRITVSDRGPGVGTVDRERVFERFFRGSSSRTGTQGSGLGLAIVAQHAHAHGGRVEVQDAVPHGAAFIVELPVDNGET